mmetsp:Transcript_3869/g.11314  ORF Transcript_3869/g.11314 Transcript_3869/m.11314 type:complete len:293 (+) Transcript_3869:1406-2284(+)
MAASRAMKPPATTARMDRRRVASCAGFDRRAMDPRPMWEKTALIASRVRFRSSAPLAAICRKLMSSFARSASARALASAATRSSSAARRSASRTLSCSSCFSLRRSSVARRCCSLRRFASSWSRMAFAVRFRSRSSSRVSRSPARDSSWSTTSFSTCACLARVLRCCSSRTTASSASTRACSAAASSSSRFSTSCASTSAANRASSRSMDAKCRSAAASSSSTLASRSRCTSSSRCVAPTLYMNSTVLSTVAKLSILTILEGLDGSGFLNACCLTSTDSGRMDSSSSPITPS